MLADRQHIVQVLNNLLANAARQAPATTPIRVVASVEGVHVAVSVSDEGRGVPADRLPHLFRKHAGFDGEGREKGAAASSLGLAICKGLVEAHGGRVRAESAGPGHGTQITFTVPAAEENGGKDAAGVRPNRSRSLGGRARETTRVLVVDDDPQMLRRAPRRRLRAAPHGRPPRAPDLLKAQRPRLVLLDLMLPGVDGIELLQQVPDLSDVPVIFISGYGRDETVARVLELGVADYIVKPFSPTDLTARVRAALRRQADPEAFRLGELAIHHEERRVQVAGPDRGADRHRVRAPPPALRQRRSGHYVDFSNACSYALDVHSIACYTRDGVQAPGSPNRWFYLPSLGAERQYYTLGTDYQESVRFAVTVNYRACRAGNRTRCGEAELVCP